MRTKIRTALLVTMLVAQAGSSVAQQEPPCPDKGATFDQLFTKKTPVIAKRGVHMHLTGLPPTGERFVQLLKIFAAARYNVVVIEWEDSFPWTVEERFRSRTAYTPDEIRRICKTADELGLELIPLVQCLGHMETPLSTSGYEHLREVPNNSSGINPLNPKSRELIQGNKGLGHLRGTVRQSERLADEVRRSFDGLIDPIWIDEYVATRLSPLKDELDALTAQDEALT